MSKIWTKSDVEAATKAQVISSVASEFDGVSTDTREDLSGKLFIALRGENYDAHDFIANAAACGVTGVVVDQWRDDWDVLKDKLTIFKVEDTLKALQDLALFWRKKNNFKVIAITGSNGKTTTKEFTATLIEGSYRIAYSKGSFNNHWGVPLSLLQSDSQSEVVVLEMGMNHRGEIKKLCEIAVPDVVVVTTVGHSHVGEVGTIEDVILAKQEIYENSPNAIAVYNITNEYTLGMLKREAENKWHKKVLAFSAFGDFKSEVRLRVDQVTFDGLIVKGVISNVEGEANVPVFGRQNLYNIMAAACLAVAVGVEPSVVWSRLTQLQTIWGRNQVLVLKSGAHVVFDAYNANPESMTALVKNLYEMSCSGKKVAILGEMMELGEYSGAFHRELGQMVGKSFFDYVWFVGSSGEAFAAGLKDAGFEKNFDISDTYKETLAIQVRNMLNDEDIAIIKGSRSIKLEQVLECLQPVDMPQKN